MRATLYTLTLSHPGHAARLALECKGIEHEVVNLLPGFHAALLRVHGFRGGTVPALKIDGRRVQRSLEITRALEEIQPEPALFPADATLRGAVEEAEAWGERELQPIPRRAFRRAAATSREIRLWMAKDLVGMPAPRVMAWANAPVARYFAGKSGADEDGVRSDMAALPGLLGRVDELIAQGVIGGSEPNAADFQIGTTVRVLMAFDDLRSLVEGRPAAALAERLLPEYPGPIPPVVPKAWLPA